MKLFFRALAVLLTTMIFMPWFALASDPEEVETEAETSEEEEADCTVEGSEYGYENGENEDCDIPAETTTDIYYPYGSEQPIISCNFPQHKAVLYAAMDEDMDLNEETALVEGVLSSFEEAYSSELYSGDSSELGLDGGRCGQEVHPTTNSLEQSDCAAEGKVVTEITESFAGSTSLADEATVVTVYKDICCMVIKSKIIQVDGQDVTSYECKDQRSIYHLDREDCNDESPYCEKRQWIIGTSGASIIKVYVKQIYIWASGAIGFIAVVTIVLNGIRISVSGVSGDITEAKERIFQAISGLVLLFLSGLILYTINPNFFS